VLIVVDPPGFDLGLRIFDGREWVDVQALVAETPVERLDEGILHGFPRPNEVELDATTIRPAFERAT
jgi:hypothetical protein